MSFINEEMFLVSEPLFQAAWPFILEVCQMGIMPDEDKEGIGRIVRMEMKNFLESDLSKPLEEKGKAELKSILRLFLECIYIYHDNTPKEMHPSELRAVVLETLPRRFSGDEKYLSRVPEVVSAYMNYLMEEVGLEDESAYEKILKEMSKKFVKAVKKVNDNERLPGEETIKITREKGKVGRNDPCPCGSGKKHKKCCM